MDQELLEKIPEVTDLIKNINIDREPRGWEKPTDHTPVILELNN